MPAHPRRTATACVVALFWAGTAVAQSAAVPASAGQAAAAGSPAPVSRSIGPENYPLPLEIPLIEPLLPEDLLRRFHRQRQRLKDAGITVKLHEESEVWGNLTGGRRQGLSYNGLTVGKLDIDLEKAIGWTGAEFYVSAFDIHGHGPTRSLVGNQQLVSNIEATPSIKLYDLWLDQTLFDKRLSLRIGQEGANDEMMVSAYGGLFLNSSFGFPGMPAADLPSGGPNYPVAAPFVRAQATASDTLTVVGAVYTDDPAPPGPGDPQIRDRNGTAFRLDDHALMFGELRYSPDPAASDALPTTYKLGLWYASGPFADQRYDSAGGLLASPTSTGLPREHDGGDYAFYGIIDQAIWHRPGVKNAGVGAFVQVMAGPSDRNLSNLFVEGGLYWHAPAASRPDDVAGLAVSYLGISPAAQAFSRDLVMFGRAASAYAKNETVIEATYQAPLTDWLTMQPDAQLVLNPGAGIPGPLGRVPLAPSLVLGLRVTIRL
jgi:porin